MILIKLLLDGSSLFLYRKVLLSENFVMKHARFLAGMENRLIIGGNEENVPRLNTRHW